ncbi:hypothetical protein EYF80_035828 [Liparis tanakae]|uniref:Uncharacterized protein n=1 Tax=Liparis tanakae TaxID=230148 RepID=A0A4Z2GL36_9TELE|nr:hypothetical protein EYF80_035828 [Liparis tanakae]
MDGFLDAPRGSGLTLTGFDLPEREEFSGVQRRVIINSAVASGLSLSGHVRPEPLAIISMEKRRQATLHSSSGDASLEGDDVSAGYDAGARVKNVFQRRVSVQVVPAVRPQAAVKGEG